MPVAVPGGAFDDTTGHENPAKTCQVVLLATPPGTLTGESGAPAVELGALRAEVGRLGCQGWAHLGRESLSGGRAGVREADGVRRLGFEEN